MEKPYQTKNAIVKKYYIIRSSTDDIQIEVLLMTYKFITTLINLHLEFG